MTDLLAARSGLLDYKGYFGLGNGGAIAIQATDANNSDTAVIDTLGVMAGHCNRAMASPQVATACSQAGIRDGMTEDQIINRVFAFVKQRVMFVEDETQLAEIFNQPNSKELLITPPVLLSMKRPRGDCDDFSMLACSMLMRYGIKCSFKTVAADARHPAQFTHVYCIVGDANTPFDASHGKRVGWETDKRYREMVWPVIRLGESMDFRSGLGDDGFDDGGFVDPGTYSAVTPVDTSGSGWNIYAGVNPVYTGSQASVLKSTAQPASSSSFSNILASVIPGLFGAGEKIAVQTTQKAGYTQTGPNGTISYVAGPGTTGLAIPGLSLPTSGSSSSMLLILAALGIGLVLFSKKG